MLKGKDKKYKRLRHSITEEACIWLLPVLVASPAIAIAIAKRQTTKKKSKVGTPVAINYRENKHHV